MHTYLCKHHLYMPLQICLYLHEICDFFSLVWCQYLAATTEWKPQQGQGMMSFFIQNEQTLCLLCLQPPFWPIRTLGRSEVYLDPNDKWLPFYSHRLGSGWSLQVSVEATVGNPGVSFSNFASLPPQKTVEVSFLTASHLMKCLVRD